MCLPPRESRSATIHSGCTRCEGIFEAGKHVDAAHGVSLYRVRQAQVEEAVGAKVMKVEEATPLRQ